MLSWFRKYSKSWMVKAFYVLVAITFFGGFGILSVDWLKKKPAEESKEAVAIVNGEDISAQDFNKSYERAKRAWYERMSRLYGEIPENLLDTEALKQDVLDELVGQALLGQEAKKLGIKVSNSEVSIQISQIPYFKDQTGAFNQNVYKNTLNRLQVTPEEFEEEIRQQLLVSRVTNLIVAPVQAGEDEVKAYYQKSSEEINLDYFFLDAEGRYGKLKPTEKEMEDYYQSHPKDFDWPEVRKIEYFRFPIADFEKIAQISEADLKDYYEKSKDRYQAKPEQGHFRHILIKLAENAAEPEVKKAKDKADKIIDEFMRGEKFAELAKRYSEDSETAINGGDLGWAGRGTFIPEFEKAGYELAPGEISAPIRTKYGFHIIQLEELKPAEYKPLEEVREELKKELIRNQAHLLAQEKAEAVLKDCLGKGMKEAAKKYQLELRPSEYFKKGESDLEGLPDSRYITEEAFYMNLEEISEVFSGIDDLYIFELLEIKDSHQATREEANPKILRKLEPEIRLAKTKEDARKALEALSKGASMPQLAKKEKAELKETGFFQRGAKSLPEIGSSEDLTKLIFNLTSQEPVPKDVYDAAGKVYVFQLKAVKPADPAKFEEEKAGLQKTLLSKKQQETFDRYLENLKKDKVKVISEIYQQIE